MCSVCGCSNGVGKPHASHDHEHERHLVRIEQNILAKNDRYAELNRRRLAESTVLALNLVSSPGAGKTTLLVETLKRLRGRIDTAVIEGDQQTSLDADRIRETGVPTFQINTGRGCHLDAHMIGHALDELMVKPSSILFVENVGNLVCPASFDLGEAEKIAILSVTEGDDKPLKYPDVFAAAGSVVISKIDLLRYVDFDVERCIENARSINPNLHAFRLSASTGEGMDIWIGELLKRRARIQQALIHA
jgi:hydrogenase nickel incorporation protein HypB